MDPGCSNDAPKEGLDIIQLEAMAKCTISFNYDNLTTVLANILSKLKSQESLIHNLQLKCESKAPSPSSVASSNTSDTSDRPHQEDKLSGLG